MAIVSISSRSQRASRKASSTKPRARCAPVSTARPNTTGEAPPLACTTATLRTSEENSTAKIFIYNFAVRLPRCLDLNAPESHAAPGREGASFQPALDPFDHSDAGRPVQILIESCCNNFATCGQTVEVQME